MLLFKNQKIMFNLKFYHILFPVLLFLISCEKTDYSEVEEESIKEISEVSDIETKVTLSNGNTIRFHQIDDGEVKGTFLLEESECGECSVLNEINELAGKELSEEEVFWALSESGSPVPSFLKTENEDLQQQGWAREIAVKFTIGDFEKNPTRKVACNNENFTSSIAGGFLGDPEFVALDKTPNTYNGFVNDCANLNQSMCSKGPRYRLHAVMRGIKKWKGKICSKAVQSSTNDHNFTNPSGWICQSPPCDPYAGPELYFEYYSNGKWKSMKNPSGQYPEGFEVPANSTKVYSYSWNTNVKTSFRLRVKNAMGKDQFDFMMDRKDVVVGGGDGGGTGSTSPEDFPQLPSHIEISGMQNYSIIVDFTTMVDGKPRITLPIQFLSELPTYEGEIIFPNNFCGIRVIKGSRFIWLNSVGEVVDTHPYNYVPEESSIDEIYGSNYYLGGIELSGPIGACENGMDNWMFPFPLTVTETVMNQPLKLVIELEQDSKIEFLNYNFQPEAPLDAKDLFEPVDFDALIDFYTETFYEGFEQWIEVVCDQNPDDCPLED